MNSLLTSAFFDGNPQVDVLESEYKRLLGYPPGHTVSGRSRELWETTIAWYEQHGRPWIFARQVETVHLDGGAISIEGQKLTSNKLHDQYKKASVQSAVIVVASAGNQCEDEARKFWKEGKPDAYFFMEMYGSAVTEFLISTAGHRLCTLAEDKNLAVLPHYSPGYSGWDIADQICLMHLIQKRNPKVLAGKISMLESGMLVPKKSQVALFGIAPENDQIKTHETLIPCFSCALADCNYRRRPYRKIRQPIEAAK